MGLRARLVAASLLVVLLLGATTIYTGGRLIDRTVRRQAQHHTELDLRSARARLDSQLRLVQETIEHTARAPVSTRALADPAAEATRVALEHDRIRYHLDVLSICDPRGRVLLRSCAPYTAGGDRSVDPIVGPALKGQPANGIVILSAQDLEREGCDLARRAFVNLVHTPRAKPSPREAESSGMLLWAAAPVRGDDDAILGTVYGGILLNRNDDLVDHIRNTVFGDETYAGKPFGTVTIFQWDVRIATNVRNEQGNRALGTRVSAEVYDSVLENGRRWHERAFVVNDWYISAYEPIRDPRGRTIGILYVGILERKYTDLRNAILRSFIIPVGIAIALSIAVSIALARMIGRPVGELLHASRQLASGDLAHRPRTFRSAPELNQLVEAYTHMADAIGERDEALRRQNLELETSNEKLTQVNRNYMEMLGFVTHELKNPLNSLIFSAAALRDGFIGDLTDKQKETADRIVRNAKYLDEMIADYLNLSRIEKGEMALNTRPIDLRTDVVHPMLTQLQGHIDEAGMTLDDQVPDGIRLVADPGLLRIVIDNLVNNAAKYGRAGGRIAVRAAPDDGHVRISVWNEGEGIREENIPRLFGKFVRLDQPSTGARKGAGLGLFVCREIVDKHGGRIWAESEAGSWAEFIFSIPLEPPAPSPA